MIPEQMAFFAAVALTTFTVAAHQVKLSHIRTRRALNRVAEIQRDAVEEFRDATRNAAPMGFSRRPRIFSSMPVGVKSVGESRTPHCDYCGRARDVGKTSCHGCGAPVEEVLPPLLTLENPLLELYTKGLASRQTVLDEFGFDYLAERKKLS